MRLARFHFAAENGAVLDRQALGANFAGNPTGIPQLNPLRTVDFSIHVAANDDLARRDIRFDFAVGTNGTRGTAELEFALHSAVDKQIFFADNFTFDANALRDTGGSTR